MGKVLRTPAEIRVVYAKGMKKIQGLYSAQVITMDGAVHFWRRIERRVSSESPY